MFKPLVAAAAAPKPRSQDHAPLCAKLALVCEILSFFSGVGCDDAQKMEDAQVPFRDRDSGSDAGPVDKGASCGVSELQRVQFEENGTRIPGVGVKTVERSLMTTVLRVEQPSADLGFQRSIVFGAGDETFAVHLNRVPTAFVKVGEHARIDWMYKAQDTYAEDTRMQVEITVDDKQVLFYTYGQGLPEGFTYEWSTIQCQGHYTGSTYPSWLSRRLRLTGPCGDTVEVGTDESAQVCGYDVYPHTLLDREHVTSSGTLGEHRFRDIALTLIHAAASGDEDAGT